MHNNQRKTPNPGWHDLTLPNLLRPARHLAKNTCGSNAVEFALILPVFLVLLFASIAVGWYLGIAHSLEQISADVGRYAMVGLTAEERQALIERRIEADAGSYVLIRPEKLVAAGREDAGSLTVTVRYDASYIPVPLLLADMVGSMSSIERSATVMLP